MVGKITILNILDVFHKPLSSLFFFGGGGGEGSRFLVLNLVSK